MNHIKICCLVYRYNLHDFVESVTQCSLFAFMKFDSLFGNHNLLNLLVCAPFLLQLFEMAMYAFQGKIVVYRGTILSP